MSEEIDRLLTEVQRLRAATIPQDPEGMIARAEQVRDNALAAQARAERERDRAVEALELLRASVGWTMKALEIRDIIMMRGQEIPIAADDWLPGWNRDPEDTDRLTWINKHGRIGMHEESCTIAIPHGGFDPTHETLPEVYNVRHWIDVCRRHFNPEAARRLSECVPWKE